MMKSAWAAQLDLLRQVDLLCQKHHINYYAAWGSLLGTVRHHGFIPWDDDIDICMKRADYLRFTEVMEECEDLLLLNIHTAPDYGTQATKIIDKVTYTTNRQTLKERYGFPFTIGIDLFVIDCVPRDKALEEEQIGVLRDISAVYNARQERLELDATLTKAEKRDRKIWEKNLLKKIKKDTQVTFSQEPPTDQELMILWEEVAGLYGEEDSDYYTQMDCLGNGWDYYMPKDVLASVIHMPFENFSMPVPAGYEWILQHNYGDDYMTPIHQEAGHGYPFYNVAFETVAEKLGQTEEEVKDHVRKAAINYYWNFLNKSTQPTLTYPEDAFAKEKTEDGILVTEDRKRIWAAQLEVYEEVYRICQKHQLSVFAVGDTLQGAVERGNYLPTSEDMHLAMPRKDYMKLLEILPEELGAWFDYRSVYSNDNHTDLRCYIITDDYLCDAADYAKRFHGCTHLVGLDIAPVDTVSPDAKKEETRRLLVQNLLETAKQLPESGPYTEEILAVAKQWEDILQIPIEVGENIKHGFVKAADMVAGSYRQEGQEVCIFSEMQTYPKEWLQKVTLLPFGPVQMAVPKQL
jgi:lipopolysaccharide cholinephosphotransferase